ncbi:EF-hand domain pair [Cinara cedri]|uniref:EF-hand domain pair n=1 Tax=Cinara cedri TaxID=506608 RepID=A0A5E4NF28_9HEMI|nr:EF-hand domain pair [Cinara cedri]
MADLSKEDVERVNFVWGIYDSANEGVDAFYLGDLLRALETNPTLATIEKIGGTKKKGEKKFMLDEFYAIYSQIQKDKDQGVYEDFIECLKLYDKAEDGTMIGGELTHILLSLGEKLNDAELDEVVKDCMEQEDEDGFIHYVPFVKKVMVKLSDMK